MSAPSGYIRSLVSGLPSSRRAQHLLLMLQAFVDESWIQRGPPIFAMGGFIAPVEIWERFSDEWQRVLDMNLRIEYFKNDEAAKLRDQFLGWSDARRDERVLLLRKVIERYKLGYFYFAVRTDELQEAFKDSESAFRNPYGMGLIKVMTTVGRRLGSIYGQPVAPVDFYFDTQVMERDKIMRGWDFIKANHRQRDAELFSKILINPPTFRDDKTVLPLQAADMLAGCVGRELSDRLAQGLAIHSDPSPMWEGARSLNGIGISMDKSQLDAYATKMKTAYGALSESAEPISGSAIRRILGNDLP